jgi:putative ABC transport system permease protein
VAEAARLRGVAAVAGGITLLDSTTTFQKHGDGSQPSGYTIDGVDTGDASLGPLGSASLVSGHSFTTAEADADVAVVDSGYAKSHNLTVGSAVTIDQMKYTVIGIVRQPSAGNPPSIYIPLARAQAMPLLYASLKNDVNTIYLTTASSLAGQVTGSLASAAKLADDLGRWLSVLAAGGSPG